MPSLDLADIVIMLLFVEAKEVVNTFLNYFFSQSWDRYKGIGDAN